MRTATRHLVVLVAAGVMLTGCGIGSDDAPRDIVPQAPTADDDQGRTAITATATTLIYLVGHGEDGRFVLMPIARDTTETLDNALVTLFDGPTAREMNADLRTAIPSSVRLVKAVTNNNVVTIDVSADLTRLVGSTLVDAIGQIVLTATNVTGITGVVITVGDVPHPWPLPDGTTTVEPLMRDDYEELLPDDGNKATEPTVDTVPSSVAPTVTVPATTAAPAQTPPATTVEPPATTVAPPPPTEALPVETPVTETPSIETPPTVEELVPSRRRSEPAAPSATRRAVT